jgi:hypothetical protein
VQERAPAHDLARCAAATLPGVRLEERLLHGVPLAMMAQPFDRGDLLPRASDREQQTGVQSPALHQHRAGATIAHVADLLRARPLQVRSTRLEQGVPGRYDACMCRTMDM